METRSIEVEDLRIPATMGRPVAYEGKHAGRELAGIDLELRVGGPEYSERVDELFARDTVWVQDPFANRRYEAVPRIRMTSYREGEWQRHYTAELREVDRPPEFEILEIEGHRFPVINYVETDPEEDVVGRYALLRLSQDQFLQLRKLLELDVRSQGEVVGWIAKKLRPGFP